MIREEAISDEEYVQDFCNKNNIECYTMLFKKAKRDNYTLVLSTASCYKFEDAIKDAKVKFSMDNAIPNIKKVMNSEIEENIKNNAVNEEKVWEMVRCLK